MRIKREEKGEEGSWEVVRVEERRKERGRKKRPIVL